MPEESPKKDLVSRRANVAADERGQSAGVDPARNAELELVSTQMLKVILTSRDDSDRLAIESVAGHAGDGVLARNPQNGQFEIIDDDELQTILDANQGLPQITRPPDATLQPLRDYADDDQMSLVSARALRKALHTDDDESNTEAGDSADFSPYDAN